MNDISLLCFFLFRQKSVHLQGEAEVCGLISVPEEEVGDWLSPEVGLLGEGEGRWELG